MSSSENDNDASFQDDGAASDDSWSGEEENAPKQPQATTPADLKSALKKRTAEVQDLKAENKRLKAELAKARTSSGSPGSALLNPGAAKEQAKAIQASLIKNLYAQMAYKKGL